MILQKISIKLEILKFHLTTNNFLFEWRMFDDKKIDGTGKWKLNSWSSILEFNSTIHRNISSFLPDLDILRSLCVRSPNAHHCGERWGDWIFRRALDQPRHALSDTIECTWIGFSNCWQKDYSLWLDFLTTKGMLGWVILSYHSIYSGINWHCFVEDGLGWGRRK